MNRLKFRRPLLPLCFAVASGMLIVGFGGGSSGPKWRARSGGHRADPARPDIAKVLGGMEVVCEDG